MSATLPLMHASSRRSRLVAPVNRSRSRRPRLPRARPAARSRRDVGLGRQLGPRRSAHRALGGARAGRGDVGAPRSLSAAPAGGSRASSRQSARSATTRPRSSTGCDEWCDLAHRDRDEAALAREQRARELGGGGEAAGALRYPRHAPCSTLTSTRSTSPTPPPPPTARRARRRACGARATSTSCRARPGGCCGSTKPRRTCHGQPSNTCKARAARPRTPTTRPRTTSAGSDGARRQVLLFNTWPNGAPLADDDDDEDDSDGGDGGRATAATLWTTPSRPPSRLARLDRLAGAPRDAEAPALIVGLMGDRLARARRRARRDGAARRGRAR